MNEALIILTKPPFGRVLAGECIRMASGLKAMEINAVVILIGEATFTLIKNQDGSGVHMPSMQGGLDILAMSEGRILVVQEDLDMLGLQRGDLIEYPYLEIIDRDDLDELVVSARCTFRF
ncbi:MAG TPA: DsrE family protein [Candidatus Lokiarchaeia archaeon]|nr:DsrE family protein [Candidatus Lokiarchaeia archaeon]